MRTTVEENKEAARFIANKINLSAAPIRVLLPEKGISALDCFDKPFYDKDATSSLLVELENVIEKTAERDVSLIFELAMNYSFLKFFLNLISVDCQFDHFSMNYS